jgi:GH15 family glucan-1,4-alpha-glucosidase
LTCLPVENHGVIGDMHTVAVVGTDGTIGWLCLPRFDSASVFASLPDDSKGRHFRVAPERPGAARKQPYWPDTNVLVTRFLSAEGVGEIVDFLPICGPTQRSPALVRRVSAVRGSIGFHAECQPAFNFACDPHRVQVSGNGAAFDSLSLNLRLLSRIPFQANSQGGVTARFSLKEGESALFLLRQAHGEDDAQAAPVESEGNELFEKTAQSWRRWMARCTYRGRWREMVHRSALVLKLLTFAPTGAIIAAPTCSLPEFVGGECNWDYRYTWIRDAAFTLYALMRIGDSEEAGARMKWTEARCHETAPDSSLQIMYGIDGRHDLQEEILPHLEGYGGSRPVRVGNAAFRQHQLDIYGEPVDSVYLYNKHGTPLSYELWKDLRPLLDWVCDHWHQQDRGLWEVRGHPRHFVFSKVMCWVALDRGIRLAD